MHQMMYENIGTECLNMFMHLFALSFQQNSTCQATYIKNILNENDFDLNGQKHIFINGLGTYKIVLAYERCESYQV